MSCTVLLIEDEEALARNVKLYLERKGFEVRAAASAEAGLEQIESFRPDAVVLDFNLPGMSGLEALERIRRFDRAIAVVMVTGHGSEQVAVDAMKAGAYDYLTKPVALGKLALVLDRAQTERRREQELAHHRRGDPAAAGLAALLGDSAPMRELRAAVSRIVEAERMLSGGDPPAVLITGETGTGKELVARALHLEGPRASGPFVEINCASIPAQLLEAELFGFERGAFTDAKERKLGLVEAADGGTLFLDEIGECDLGLQAKLLKLLEDRRFRRLGSVREQQVSLRVVAATNRDLEAMARDGRFRSDLFFRLRILHVRTPPLRSRGDDVAALARHFLRVQCARYGRPALELAPEALEALRAHPWPGNVRELRNVIEQSVIMARGERIEARDLVLTRWTAEGDTPGSAGSGTVTGTASPAPGGGPPAPAAAPAAAPTLAEAERRMLLEALNANRWNVSKAARQLGVSRDTLRYRMQKFGLTLPG
jgi:DNA-binding NtrC family response regulator